MSEQEVIAVDQQQQRQTNALIDQSSTKAFEVVSELNKLSLITPNEVRILKDAQVFLLSTYTDVPAFRTYIEKYVGVLTNSRFPTPDSKFWQCKKEAEVQFNELLKAMLRHKAYGIEMDELNYKIGILETQKKEAEHPLLVGYDIAKLQVKVAEIGLHIKGVEKEIKYRILEIGDWNTISKEWEGSMKHSKDIYSQHEVDSMLGYLSKELAAAVDKKDEKSSKVLSAQLDTLKSVIKRHLDKVMKQG